MTRPAHLVVLTTALIAALASTRGEAHKPITSPYTYNEDVFPILRDRCGRCHVTGGVAPMSLMSYKEAFPWGESIRTELIAGRMPPGRTDRPADAFRNMHELSARELNVLMVWATGGNPMGNAEHSLPAVSLQNDWPLGTPDLVLPMPAPFTIAADKVEETQEVTLQTHTTGPRWLRAVDLLPGTPAIVRSAIVSVKTASPESAAEKDHAAPAGGTSPRSAEEAVAAERVLAVWTPGDTPVALDGGTAFQLPANADLVLRVHYKKTWENERIAMTDRSSVGLYFAPASATTPLRALAVTPSGDAVRADGPSASFSRVVKEDLQAVALYPDRALADVNLEVRADRPDGTRVDLIRFRPIADWAKRYWFAEPVPLPQGTRITVVATFNDVLLPPGAAPVAPKRPDAAALRMTLNVVGK
jgi:hypothetical protein